MKKEPKTPKPYRAWSLYLDDGSPARGRDVFQYRKLADDCRGMHERIVRVRVVPEREPTGPELEALFKSLFAGKLDLAAATRRAWDLGARPRGRR